MYINLNTAFVAWGSLTITDEMMDQWLPRCTQISMVELFAVPCALQALGDRLRNTLLEVFGDSEAAEGSLTKGGSGKVRPPMAT